MWPIVADLRFCSWVRGRPEREEEEVGGAHSQISGDSSEPSGQSFSPSQRQPLEMQVTWSLHTNCLELHVLG